MTGSTSRASISPNRTKSPTDSDPRITAYLASREGEDLTIARLKSDRMEAIAPRTASRNVLGRSCAALSIKLSSTVTFTSFLQGWFRIDLGFKDRVYANVGRLRSLERLPEADRGTDEGAYNIKAATAVDGLCLARSWFMARAGPSGDVRRIEPGMGLVRVKHRGSSSTLSHLFAQGLNCAERLLQDADFRRKAREVVEAENADFNDVLPTWTAPIPKRMRSTSLSSPRSDRDTPLTLPFFSVVDLRAAASRLQGFGFRVSIAGVTRTVVRGSARRHRGGTWFNPSAALRRCAR